MNKRIILFLLSLAMLFALVSCDTSEQSSTSITEKESTEETSSLDTEQKTEKESESKTSEQVNKDTNNNEGETTEGEEQRKYEYTSIEELASVMKDIEAYIKDFDDPKNPLSSNDLSMLKYDLKWLANKNLIFVEDYNDVYIEWTQNQFRFVYKKDGNEYSISYWRSSDYTIFPDSSEKTGEFTVGNEKVPFGVRTISKEPCYQGTIQTENVRILLTVRSDDLYSLTEEDLIFAVKSWNDFSN